MYLFSDAGSYVNGHALVGTYSFVSKPNVDSCVQWTELPGVCPLRRSAPTSNTLISCCLVKRWPMSRVRRSPSCNYLVFCERIRFHNFSIISQLNPGESSPNPGCVSGGSSRHSTSSRRRLRGMHRTTTAPLALLRAAESWHSSSGLA